MKTIAAIVLVIVALVPAGTAAQATDVTGNWNAKFARPASSGQTQSMKFTFHFTQKGKVLSGTIGPESARQMKIEKGVVDGAKITFSVKQPNGGVRTFTLTHTKGRLQGTQTLELNGRKSDATVVAERAK